MPQFLTNSACLEYVKNLPRFGASSFNFSNGVKWIYTKKKTSHIQYFDETMIGTDYSDDKALLANAPAKAECLLNSLRHRSLCERK